MEKLYAVKIVTHKEEIFDVFGAESEEEAVAAVRGWEVVPERISSIKTDGNSLFEYHVEELEYEVDNGDDSEESNETEGEDWENLDDQDFGDGKDDTWCDVCQTHHKAKRPL